MKKFKKSIIFTLIFLCTLFNTIGTAFAVQTKNLTLKNDDEYILFMDSRPMQIQISNPRLVKVQVVSDIFNTDSKVIIKTYDKGTTNIFLKTKTDGLMLNVSITDKANLNDNIMQIDTP